MANMSEMMTMLSRATEALLCENPEQAIEGYDTILSFFTVIALCEGVTKHEILTSLAAQLVGVAMHDEEE